MRAIELIKKFEGLRLDAYRDQAGVWTIGYGHAGSDVKPGMSVDEAEAERMLKSDMRWAEEAVDSTVTAPITGAQRAALVSLVFNIGAGAWRRSTALRRVNAGDYAGAAEAITWWNKVTVDGEKIVSSGLVRRRERERDLFMSDVPTENAPGTTEPAPERPVTGGEQKDPMKGESKTFNVSLFGTLASGAAAITQAFGGMDWRVGIALVVVGTGFAYLAFNRWLEARRGEH